MSGPIAKGSIRRNLVIQLALVAAILSLALFLLVRGVAERAAEDTQDNILAASATSIADAVQSGPDGITLELPYSALSMLGAISQDRVFYKVEVAGEALTGYDDLPATTRPFSTFDYRGEAVRAATIVRSVTLNNRSTPVSVTVAQTQQGLAVISRRITATTTAFGAIEPNDPVRGTTRTR